jgi:DNA repair photolyase
MRGKESGFAYSLSRWTDLPAAKWEWFEERLRQESMLGIHPQTGMPRLWSLRPEDTLGMVFWTRDGRNLVKHEDLLEPYQKRFHFTLTGWQEVERKAPNIKQGLHILGDMVSAFGAENITWRFSPIPTLMEEVFERFERIAEGVQRLGIRTVYVSFLQNNDLMQDKRGHFEREFVLRSLADAAPELTVILCNEDRSTFKVENLNFRKGICEDGSFFGSPQETEGYGCALAVDPFTVNESCCFGCKYCYAANKDLAPKKRNTTKALPVLR